jgi:hypothetical protein
MHLCRRRGEFKKQLARGLVVLTFLEPSPPFHPLIFPRALAFSPPVVPTDPTTGFLARRPAAPLPKLQCPVPFIKQKVDDLSIVIGTSYSLSSSGKHSTEGFDPDSKSIIARFEQPVEHDLDIVSIDDRMQIDWSDGQSANADPPRSETAQPGSNVTVERLRQCWKQHLAIVSSDAGMRIDSSDEQSANADPPRLETRQPISNVTIDRSVQE